VRAPLLIPAAIGLSLFSGLARGDDHVERLRDRGTEAARAIDLARNSISCGSANRGALREAAEVPRQGMGFVIPEPWWSRGYRYGTDELVGLIARAAAVVDAQYPGGVLGVADLSRPEGGALPGHRSHQSGRDADLIFYAMDAAGQPFHPDEHMPFYTYNGRAHYAKAPHYARGIPERRFDLARNWALIKAMLDDPDVRVEHIFVSRRIRRWLLDHARRIGEPEELVKHAGVVLRLPPLGGHNDHMHVRVSCSADDKALGRCTNSIIRKPGRRKFYSHVRCPATPAHSQPQAQRNQI
jgi:penicillin-insensitive murein DD-endopeptidase